MKRILFVFSREASFIAIDRALLEERWAVTPWRQQGPVVNLPKLVREVARSDLVFGWFASWHTFLPVMLARLMGKPSVIVIGGSLSQAGDSLLAGIREAIYARSLPLATTELQVVASRTANQAAVRGGLQPGQR